MSFKLSTGLRNAMLDTGSFRTALNGGFIKFYNGSPPSTADAAETGTVLCIVSTNATGTGLNFETVAASGSIPKKTSEVWSGTNLVTGTATYFRFIAAGDTGVSSTTEKRLQGTCGTSGADCNMTSVNLSVGALQTVDAASFSLPTF